LLKRENEHLNNTLLINEERLQKYFDERLIKIREETESRFKNFYENKIREL
jgi:hypothetical protein